MKPATYSSHGYLRDESLALLDVLLEFGQTSGEELLFLGRELANGVNLLNTVQLARKRTVQYRIKI